MNSHSMRCLSHVEENQLSRIVLRTGFGRTSISKCKSFANCFAFWLPGPQWQQKLFRVLQLLYQLRISPSLCLTKVLKFNRTIHMTPSTLPLARSEPICCTEHRMTSCCSVTVGQGYLWCTWASFRGQFFDVYREMFGCRVFSLHLDFILQPSKEPAASAQQLY